MHSQRNGHHRPDNAGRRWENHKPDTGTVEHDPDGGCVALWTMNPETEEQEAPARLYGDWQASEYLGDVLAELKPRRKVNLPDFPAIVRAAMADGMDICVYCQSFDCNECIVNEWKSERSGEE